MPLPVSKIRIPHPSGDDTGGAMVFLAGGLMRAFRLVQQPLCTSFLVSPVRIAMRDTVCFFPSIPNSFFATST